MAANLPDPVAKCVTILKAASNDTEKFAALFMVTKLVKGPMCDSSSKKALFEAIGFNFLKRLLLTSDVPTDCPPLVYKSVAMSVLSSFCCEKELASHPEMLNNIPVFFDIVQQADDDDFDDYLIIVSEAYQCLLSIASYEPGQNVLFEMGAVSKLSEIYAQQSFQTDEALNILVSLASRFGPAVWQGDSPKPFHCLMNKIALDFETDQDERKFELCGIMYSLLFNCQKQVVADTAGEESWQGSIYKGLNDILTSKISKAQRDPALKLASVTVDVLGVKWCLTDENKPRQFFLLLVQLCSIEVRMQLEDRKFNQVIDNAELVSACFVFLEHAISFIAIESNSDTFELEQKEKQQIYTALKGAFAAVINVLSKLAKDSQSNKNDKMTVEEKVFICAMVRVLAAWLAQETQAMRNAIYQILPFILGFANDTFYAYRARYITEKVRMENKSQATLPDQDPLSQIDVLRLLLPALCHLTVEDQARKTLLEVKEDEVLHECLAFHWSIVHYKKPPIPKSERNKVKKEPEKELPAKLLEDMKDSRAAMISICNIFMNITVLEPKMVEESGTFAMILKFLFNNLPDLKNIPENLVLHGNMAVFGLLLLKQHSKRVNKNDFSICRYIQATIRFLWDAFNVDESSDNSLVVALSYKEKWMELMELWFLGMQTMSAVLSAIPWISEFAIESGWVQGIVETLNKVKIGGIPSNTKSAYEDFLCNVVEANNSITQVLKENNALAMCRKHRFMELGKKLFGD